MGKKVLRLFLETMLRALVIILAIGIVIMGALLIKTLVKNNSLKDSKKTTNGKEIVTEAGDENDPTFKNGDGENSGSDDSDESVLLLPQMRRSLLSMRQEQVALPVHGRQH